MIISATDLIGNVPLGSADAASVNLYVWDAPTLDGKNEPPQMLPKFKVRQSDDLPGFKRISRDLTRPLDGKAHGEHHRPVLLRQPDHADAESRVREEIGGDRRLLDRHGVARCEW